MSINSRVKEVRMACDLTQKQFGSRITLAQTYLSQIEKGDRDVTEKILKLICLEFNVNENWLRTGKGQMFNEVLEEDDLSRIFAELSISNDEFAKRFLRTYWGLSKESKSIISNFIDMLAEKKGE